MTVVYVDLLVLLNLIANYLLLMGSGRIAGCVLRRLRIGLSGLIGALYAAAVFLPGFGWLAAWPCKSAAGVLMTLIAYGGGPKLLRVTLIFYASSAALAGMVLGAELLGSSALTLKSGVFYTPLDIRLLLLLFVACYFLLSVVFRRTGKHIGRELVDLKMLLLGQRFRLTALRDTGHTLCDPVTNGTVLVVEYRSVASALPVGFEPGDPIASVRKLCDQGITGMRLVPYRAVGVDCGMLAAVRAESVTVGNRELGSLLVALSPHPVDDGGGYQALIGGEWS